MAWAKDEASEIVKAELCDVIMCHSGCHTGTILSQQKKIIEICVLRMCQQILHALNETKRSSVSQDMQVCPKEI